MQAYVGRDANPFKMLISMALCLLASLPRSLGIDVFFRPVLQEPSKIWGSIARTKGGLAARRSNYQQHPSQQHCLQLQTDHEFATLAAILPQRSCAAFHQYRPRRAGAPLSQAGVRGSQLYCSCRAANNPPPSRGTTARILFEPLTCSLGRTPVCISSFFGYF